MIPAAIVLVAVFGIVFLLTRSGTQTPPDQTQGQTGLAADPASQPVTPVGSPSGESERGIQPISVATPASNNPNANANTNAGRAREIPPTSVTGDFGANANENANTSGRGNKNTNQPRESPSPKSSPTPNVKIEAPPPPKPSPSSKLSPKTANTPASFPPS